MTILNAEHDALLAQVFVYPQVVRGSGNAYILAAGGYHLFYLVEDIVGILLRMVGRLGQVGYHDGSVLMAFGHLMHVDQNLRVAVGELDVLVKEHRCIAMGIEG